MSLGLFCPSVRGVASYLITFLYGGTSVPPSLPRSTAKGFVLGDLARNARERDAADRSPFLSARDDGVVA